MSFVVVHRRFGKRVQANYHLLSDEISVVCKIAIDDILSKFRSTVSTWSTKPEFYSSLEINPSSGISISVGTNDKIYYFLDNGTKLRWAIMTSGYVSKTSPDDPLNPVRGSGTVVVRGKKAVLDYQMNNNTDDFGPRPGIKARKFTEAVYDTTVPNFRREIRNALRRGIRKTFGQ